LSVRERDETDVAQELATSLAPIMKLRKEACVSRRSEHAGRAVNHASRPAQKSAITKR
jgi:hypothetical protein